MNTNILGLPILGVNLTDDQLLQFMGMWLHMLSEQRYIPVIANILEPVGKIQKLALAGSYTFSLVFSSVYVVY